MNSRVALRALLLAGVLTLAFAGTAAADHTHVRTVGNGECVILAPTGGESDVTLPAGVLDHNPNVVGTFAPEKSHPIHVLVHIAEAGHGGVAVFGPTDGCADYVNANALP